MKKGYIYRMISPSLKAYIGQTIRSIEHRHWMYKHPEKMHGQRKLKAALLKYGYDAFTVEVFEVPRSDLSLIETLIIAQEDSFENGYNGTEGGEKGHQKLDSELKYGIRPSDDLQAYLNAQQRYKRAHETPEERAERLLKEKSYRPADYDPHPKRTEYNQEMYKFLLTALTSEPQFAVVIGEKCGLSYHKAGKQLKLMAEKGLCKMVTLRNDNFKWRPAYYLPSAHEVFVDAGKKVGKLTKAECPSKKRAHEC